MATKSSASRFICVPDGPKVGFLFLAECASLPLNVLITEMTDYIPMPRAIVLLPGTFSQMSEVCTI